MWQARSHSGWRLAVASMANSSRPRLLVLLTGGVERTSCKKASTVLRLELLSGFLLDDGVTVYGKLLAYSVRILTSAPMRLAALFAGQRPVDDLGDIS